LPLFCHFLLTAIRQRLAWLSRREIAPILAGRLSGGRSKGTREIGLAGKAEHKRNVDQRPIAARQQSFGVLESVWSKN
jgi:hypothetical protein